MSKNKTDKYPVTTAIRALRAAKVEFTPHLYEYEEHGGTAVSSRELGVAEHIVIKTLIMQDDENQPLVVLMHGDKHVSIKNLARLIGARAITPCHPDVAEKHSGYLVGGTSPFGTKKTMPVYMQESIASLEKIYINGGKRGFLVEVAVSEVQRVLQPILVDIAVDA